MCWLHWFFICQTAYAGFCLIWRPLEVKVIDQINSNIIPHRVCYHCSLLTLYANSLFKLSGWHHENYLQYIKKNMKWKLVSTFFPKYDLVFATFFWQTKFGTSILTELIPIQLAIPPKLLVFSPLFKKPHNFQITKFTTVALYILQRSNFLSCALPFLLCWWSSFLHFVDLYIKINSLTDFYHSLRTPVHLLPPYTNYSFWLCKLLKQF